MGGNGEGRGRVKREEKGREKEREAQKEVGRMGRLNELKNQTLDLSTHLSTKLVTETDSRFGRLSNLRRPIIFQVIHVSFHLTETIKTTNNGIIKFRRKRKVDVRHKKN